MADDRHTIAPAKSGTAQQLAAISTWIDAGNEHRDREAATWARLAKIVEEAGEVVTAYIGVTGASVRKGVTNVMDDVLEELLDVAVAALAAVEHVSGNKGDSIDLLATKIVAVSTRSGLLPPVTDAALRPVPDDNPEPDDEYDGCDYWFTPAGSVVADSTGREHEVRYGDLQLTPEDAARIGRAFSAAAGRCASRAAT